jgi:pimeloyl-ACP methyl ester carboxylesterase
MPLISRTWRLPTIILAVCLVALAVLSGPLFPFTPLPSDIADVVAKVPDVDLYLRQREAQHAETKPGQAKTILWKDPAARRKTPVSLVYIHGFSASAKDIAPVIETLASTLGANAFLTRLAADGRTTPAEFATVTAQDWLDDAREALAVGRRIGSRVILIGISTGALLATMAALEDTSSDIAALVLLSPNFAIRDWRGKFISGPLGGVLARLIIGQEYHSIPTAAVMPNSGPRTTRRTALSRSWICSTTRARFISAASRCRCSSSIPTGTRSSTPPPSRIGSMRSRDRPS